MTLDLDAIAREAELHQMVNAPLGVFIVDMPALSRFAALLLEKAAEVCRDKYREHRNDIEYEGGIGDGAYWCANAIRQMAAGMGE